MITVSKILEGQDPRESSHLIGEVDFLTYADLEAMFGAPTWTEDWSDKVTCQWELAFTDGKKTFYVDVYDWKATQLYDPSNEAATYKEVTDWHFGCDTEKAAPMVRAFIGQYLNKK